MRSRRVRAVKRLVVQACELCQYVRGSEIGQCHLLLAKQRALLVFAQDRCSGLGPGESAQADV
jgi:hypothetical protein